MTSKHIWQIADENIPSDVRDLAKRWGMEETLIELWRGAFIEGWRAAKNERFDLDAALDR